jgi:hypothetical protein
MYRYHGNRENLFVILIFRVLHAHDGINVHTRVKLGLKKTMYGTSHPLLTRYLLFSNLFVKIHICCISNVTVINRKIIRTDEVFVVSVVILVLNSDIIKADSLFKGFNICYFHLLMVSATITSAW